MSRGLLVACVVLAAVAGACGSDSTTPTSASSADTVDAAVRTFVGTLDPKGTQYYSFTVAQDSGVFVTLSSVTAVGGRTAEATPLGIGLGVPRGTSCELSTRAVVTPGLAAQLRQWTTAGVYCVAVYDPGTLPSAKAFAVRIGYYQ